MTKLAIGNFIRSGAQGSFQHHFTHKLADGGEVCLEACMNGYCVARYDAHRDLIGEKICTNLDGMVEAQIMPGFSIGTGEALERAIEIANEMATG